MKTTDRRYDIDWVRVIAIGLLLIYHVAIGFQVWGTMIGFIANDKAWESLWIPMAMLNIWRIPLLFFVSGMGVYFAILKRNWKQLIMERSCRILVPFLFGMFFIVPIHLYIWQKYYQMETSYIYTPGHLWFLGNIFIYVLVLSPVFFYLRRNGKAAYWIKGVLRNPLGLFIVISAFIAEALIVNPIPYEMYARTWHGFFLGLLAFFFGFCFVLSGGPFWKMMLKWRWLFLVAAALLFTIRMVYFRFATPSYLLVIESNCWISTVLSFAYRYLNRPSNVLNYLSQAAYPVYIVHMIFLYLGSLLIFPLNIETPLKFILALLFTTIGCFAFYELLIRRMNIIRPLFGLKKNNNAYVKKEMLRRNNQTATSNF